MKVKELIEELQKQNPDAEVRINETIRVRKGEIEVVGNPASCSVPVYISGK